MKISAHCVLGDLTLKESTVHINNKIYILNILEYFVKIEKSATSKTWSRPKKNNTIFEYVN